MEGVEEVEVLGVSIWLVSVTLGVLEVLVSGLEELERLGKEVVDLGSVIVGFTGGEEERLILICDLLSFGKGSSISNGPCGTTFPMMIEGTQRRRKKKDEESKKEGLL